MQKGGMKMMELVTKRVVERRELRTRYGIGGVYVVFS